MSDRSIFPIFPKNIFLWSAGMATSCIGINIQLSKDFLTLMLFLSIVNLKTIRVKDMKVQVIISIPFEINLQGTSTTLCRYLRRILNNINLCFCSINRLFNSRRFTNYLRYTGRNLFLSGSQFLRLYTNRFLPSLTLCFCYIPVFSNVQSLFCNFFLLLLNSYTFMFKRFSLFIEIFLSLI